MSLFGGHTDMDIGCSNFSIRFENGSVRLEYTVDENTSRFTQLPHIKTKDDFLNLCWHLIGPSWGAWDHPGLARDWLKQRAKRKIYEAKNSEGSLF